MPERDLVESILADWLERKESGTAPDPAAVIRAYPELAEALGRRFAALDLVDLALAPDPRPEPDLPDQLGPYHIEELLGRGGMGTVYRAETTRKTGLFEAGEVVSLKLIHPHLLQAAGFFELFLREADIGRSVHHPNVVRTHDADSMADGSRAHHFLVMEYVEGQTLQDLQTQLGRVPEELCRHIAVETARGLAAIHAAGAIHLDLKPENVLITPDHVVKIMDLGVAQLANESLRLSRAGAFVGSLEYAAPEQLRGDGERPDLRTDLHALGVLLYELATGRHPYRDDDADVVVQRILGVVPPKAGALDPQLSPFFEEVVHTLMAKEPEQRFSDAGDVALVFEEGERSVWWKARAKALRIHASRPLRRIRLPRETALYGRDADIARMRAAYEEAKEGRGQVVLLEGEAGIGKTRLLDEFVAGLVAEGQDLNLLFAGHPPGGSARAAGAISAAYREHLGEDDLETAVARVLSQTPHLVPAFAAFLRGEAAPDGAHTLTEASLQTCFVRATRSLAAERTTLVLIDDLHFASEEGRALFAALAMAAAGHRVLLVGTMRPDVSRDWIASVARLEHATETTLSRLGPKHLADLLADTFRSRRLAYDLGARIGEKSDGNPFFVFEIVRELREGQFITPRPDGSWESSRRIDEIRIPSSVRDLVNTRVSDLTEEERELLDVAACCGFEFDATLVGEALGNADVPTLRSFAQIERRHHLVRCAGERYTFDHHQVQEALLAVMPPQLARKYHAALARTLETRTDAAVSDPGALGGELCVALCEHLLHARDGSALRYLAAAQTYLRRSYLNAQSIALSERALAAPGLLAGAERAKALLRIADPGGSLDLLGRRARQEECAREAERLARDLGDEELRIRAADALGMCFHRSSRHLEAEAAFRRALDLAHAGGDEKAEALVTGNLGLCFWAQGRLPEAQEHYERQLALCRFLGGLRHGEASAMGNLGLVFWFQGRLAEAREHFVRAIAISREVGDLLGEARATGNLGHVASSQGRFQEAMENYERSLALCRGIGDRQGEANATGNLGNILRAQGRLAEALEHYERKIAISRETGYREGEAAAAGNLGIVFGYLGRLAEAKEQFQRNLTLSREIGHREGEAYARHNLGAVLRDEGELEGSEGYLAACLALCDEIGHRQLGAQTRLALGSLRAAVGGGESGYELLVAARDAAQEHEFPGVEVLARCELALLPGGDAGGALASYAAHEERLCAEERREACLLLWKATGDSVHLEEAKRLVDEALALVPREYRVEACRESRIYREVMEAWEKHGEDAGSAGPTA